MRGQANSTGASESTARTVPAEASTAGDYSHSGADVPYPGSSVRRASWVHLFTMRRVLTALVFLAALGLYLRTLAPSAAEMFDDTSELQLVAYQLGIAHPTGYPLFTLLGKLFTLLPFGDPAYRVNLMTALFGAGAIALLFWMASRTCELALRRLPATVARLAPFAVAAVALFFASSQAFWSSATVTEVYTLNLFFVGLTFALALSDVSVGATGRSSLRKRSGLFNLFAFTYGLSLTHHRTMLLLAPAFAVFWLMRKRETKLKTLQTLKSSLKPVLLLVLPLALYLYLPLRGISVTSLDGTYQNSLSGFLQWVTASGYGVFFTNNPWGFADNPFLAYGHDLVAQFSWLGIALGLIGIVSLLKHFRIWLLFALSLTCTVFFSLAYRVADPEPFRLPSYFVFAVFMATGVVTVFAAVGWAWNRAFGSVRVPGFLELAFISLAALALLAVPAANVAANFSAMDLSREDTVVSYGLDVLSQPLEPGATIVGIGGEVTLFKYLQASRSLRPDLTFVTADEEGKRLVEISTLVAKGQKVYTTRPLAGLAERYPLQSVGPLIGVLATPNSQIPSGVQPLSERFGSALELAGYQLDQTVEGPNVVARGTEPTKAKPTLRLTLFWRALDRVPDDFSVFVHVEGPGGRLLGQKDDKPVHSAYPTSLWRPGEVVADSYDVSLLVGTPPGIYEIKIGLYDTKGSRLPTAAGAIEVSLTKLKLGRSVPAPATGSLDTKPLADAYIAPGLKIIGFQLGSRTVRPGDSLDVDLLWEYLGSSSLPEGEVSLRLVGIKGEQLAENRAQPTDGLYPMAQWELKRPVRDQRKLTIPADLADGRYQVAVETLVGHNLIYLDTIEVKGRKRVFEVPKMNQVLNATFSEGITLLGADLGSPAGQNDSGGKKLQVILYWQSRGKISANYTVFVHLVGEDGRLIAQHDSPPQGGTASTEGWVDGEVVADSHELLLPAGTPSGAQYLEVGLYDPKSGQRLQTTAGDSVKIPLTVLF